MIVCDMDTSNLSTLAHDLIKISQLIELVVCHTFPSN